jgi:hypothetical protein
MAQEMYNLDTSDGFAKGKVWMEHLLAALTDGGTWGVPKTGAIYTMDRPNRTITVTGRNDETIRMMMEACGWKVVEGPLKVKTGEWKTISRRLYEHKSPQLN